MKAPILIIQSHKGQLVKEDTAQAIYNGVSSADRRILWFEKSSHEMMRDLEREEVFKAIESFVLERARVRPRAPGDCCERLPHQAPATWPWTRPFCCPWPPATRAADPALLRLAARMPVPGLFPVGDRD